MISVDTVNIKNTSHINSEVLENWLLPYTFTADRYIEDNGSITLSLDEIDLIENGKDDDEALIEMAKGILEYAEHYCEEFDLWSSAPNRRGHIPYVLKALMINDAEKIGGLIKCRPGKI